MGRVHLRWFWFAVLGTLSDASLRSQEEPPAPGGSGQETGEGADAGEQEEEPPAVALERSVVTARKREEDPDTVPQSVTVLGQDVIRDAGLRSVRDASFHVPNLYMNEFTSRRLSFPFLRGIGSGQGDPAVTTYVDGVPQLTTSSTNLPLVGLDRIEFLRGPQGTLFGRNSLGGVIHYISRRPSAEWEADATATLGNYELEEYSAYVSGPVVDDHAFFSLTGLSSSREGYSKNLITGNDLDSRDSLFGRSQLLVPLGENSEFNLTFYGERARDGGFALFDVASLEANPRRVQYDFEGSVERNIRAPSGTFRYLGESVEVTSITGVQDWDVRETSDLDFSPQDFLRRRTKDDQRYVTEELRVASTEDAPLDAGELGTVHWLGGALFFSSDTDRLTANEVRPPAAGIGLTPGTSTSQGDFDDLGVGVFGHVTWTLFERLDLGAGLRYDLESKRATTTSDFASGGVTLFSSTQRFDRKDDLFVPDFSVAYRFPHETMLYGRAARGFKAGGFNLTAPSPAQVEFRPEKTWTYEVGVKTSPLEKLLSLQVALFHIDWDDMQLTLFDPTTGQGFVDNAGESTSRGVEVGIASEPLPGLELSGSFGYTDAEFDEFTEVGVVNNVVVAFDRSGNDLPTAPVQTWGAATQYSRELVGLLWFARAEYFAVGPFYHDAGNRLEERFALTNFRVGVGGRRWRVDGWIQNAFARDYIPIAFALAPTQNATFVGESSAPRTYGVSATLRF